MNSVRNWIYAWRVRRLAARLLIAGRAHTGLYALSEASDILSGRITLPYYAPPCDRSGAAHHPV